MTVTIDEVLHAIGQGLRLPWGGVLELEAMSGTLLSKKNGKIITIL